MPPIARPPVARTGRPWRRVVARVVRRDAGICHLCRQPGADSADHLVPVAHGGPLYAMGNLAAAHIGCNKVRGTRPVELVRAELAPGCDDTERTWAW